ncbi:DALR anticodon-binding domain-containing protein [Nonomuraea gerenzanensis]|uniref:Arginyl-tRNA synthetase related protein 1 n=1 Tax=Nonomuraea gerenzanensis TaxID=93944 RepID=A0A1M4E225_9ACTN|nr:anticodon-binding protein [Nonomuraea gerenzanensis]UBU15109.1 anticodon-binding protein [Nonomuraea gerenzanensis]SBO92852.1 Arginyl-tRNA synthetase related protein 1 [Nonomuraea gerenzanensis]
MTLPDELAEVLGEPPVPEGTWERAAGYVSAAALRRRVPAEELAARVRGLDGVAGVAVEGRGFLRIVLTEPPLDAEPAAIPFQPVWPDFPRTWDNPGFVVRYGHARACAVLRWAGQLGVPGGFEARELSDRHHRAVLRVLAELPGRLVSREPGWEGYLLRLALAYHDAHERAPAVPKGDEEPGAVHAARVRVADVVRKVLPGPDRI